MSYLKIDTDEVKFAGAGAKLQWGMVIGVAIDKYMGTVNSIPNDGDLLHEIRSHLNTAGVRHLVRDPSKLDKAHKDAIDHLLAASSAGKKLTTADLQKLFDKP